MNIISGPAGKPRIGQVATFLFDDGIGDRVDIKVTDCIELVDDNPKINGTWHIEGLAFYGTDMERSVTMTYDHRLLFKSDNLGTIDGL